MVGGGASKTEPGCVSARRKTLQESAVMTHSQTRGERRFTKRGLILARAAWFAIVALALGLFLIAVPQRFVQLRTPTPTGDDALVILAPVEAALLEQHGISLDAYAFYFIGAEALFATVYTVMGVLIVMRRSDEPLAWVA